MTNTIEDALDRAACAMVIPSFTVPDREYIVENATTPFARCSCPHFMNRGPLTCKHIAFARRAIVLCRTALKDAVGA